MGGVRKVGSHTEDGGSLIMDADLLSKLLALKLPDKHMMRVIAVLADYKPTESTSPAAVRKRRERDKKRDMSRNSHGDVTGHVTVESVTPPLPSPLPSPPLPLPPQTPPSPAPPHPSPHPSPPAAARESSSSNNLSFATLEDVKAQAMLVMATPECAEKFFNECEGSGWVNKFGNPIADWRPIFRNFATAWKNNDARAKTAGAFSGGTRQPKHAAYDAATATLGLTAEQIGTF
jgi:hypothetical protein